MADLGQTASPRAIIEAVRREPSGVCSSRFGGQTDAGQLALLRFSLRYFICSAIRNAISMACS